MRDVIKGLLVLRLIGYVPLVVVVAVVLGVSELTRGSVVAGVAILAAVPLLCTAAIGWLAARRASRRARR